MESVTVFDGESSIIQVTAKLVIKNFVRVMSVFEPGMCFESDIFKLGDTDLTIRVYPNGFNEFRGNVSVYLRNKTDADVNVNAFLSLCLPIFGASYYIFGRAVRVWPPAP